MTAITGTGSVFEPGLERVRIDSIKLDPNNPNEMTPAQMQGLLKSIRDFGNVVPVIIDQHNNIVDGEHRVRVYRDKLGLSEIPVLRVRVASDTERRLMRQTLNKLRGFIDPVKDAAEIMHLRDSGLFEDLSKLIATDTDDLRKLMEAMSPKATLGEIERMQRERERDYGAPPAIAGRGGQAAAGGGDDYDAYGDDNNSGGGSGILVLRFASGGDYDYVMSVLREAAGGGSIEAALLRIAREWSGNGGGRQR